MNYQVLARKYRPETFQNVLGQEHVTKTLLNAFKRNRIAHAYLFSGPRGVGKTSTARIMAKALNCLSDATGNPCNECQNCREIARSQSMDVLEIDGASNRGIDEIRNLRELVRYSPINAKFKVFIIDEVHMLTQAAFNALLKTLEEPPPHVKFIFATTEANKILPTIISRCQRHDFNRMSIEAIRSGLIDVTNNEQVTIEDEVLNLVGSIADGSMRDALSLTDQLIAFCGDIITMEAATNMLGVIPSEFFFQVTSALESKDRMLLVKMLNQVYKKGFALSEFIGGFNRHLLNLLISKEDGGVDFLDVSDDIKARYKEVSTEWESRDLVRYIDHVINLESDIKYVQQPRIYLEAMMLKLIEMDSSVEISQLIDKLSNSSQKVTPMQSSKSLSPARSPEKITDESIEPSKTTSKKENISNDIVEKTTKPLSDHPTLTLEKVIENWDKVVAKVSENGTSIGTFLSHGVPLEVVRSKVVIGFPERYRFQIDVLKKNSRRIETSFSKILDKELRVDFVLQQNDASATEDKNSTHPVTQRMLELFGGEITD